MERFAKEGYWQVRLRLSDRIEPGVELLYEGEDMQNAVGLYQNELKPETAILGVAAGFKQVQAKGARTGDICSDMAAFGLACIDVIDCGGYGT